MIKASSRLAIRTSMSSHASMLRQVQASVQAHAQTPAFYKALPHHAGAHFKSPWPGVLTSNIIDFFKLRFYSGEWKDLPLPPPAELPKVVAPTWGAVAPGDVRATWLGHASVLFDLPCQSGARVKVLTDPVYEDRCSPSQYLGPKRYTKPPASVSDLKQSEQWPQVVLLSHNHYDHTSSITIKSIVSHSDDAHPLPYFLVTLGNIPVVKSFGVPASHITEADWWGVVSLKLPSKEAGQPELELQATCTPAQHSSGRSMFDRAATLWGGWTLTTDNANVWFAGDTAYRSVHKKVSREEEAKLPHCPAFQELGEVCGPFDLCAIPIGAYTPRSFMSDVHVAPHESVIIHQEVKSKKSFGIHWGAWLLTPEDVNEPPKLLKEEAKAAGLADDDFVVLEIGAAVTVPGTVQNAAQ